MDSSATRKPIGFTDVMQPFFQQRSTEEVKLGLWVDEQHINVMGICHGGVLMMLSDIVSVHNIQLKHREQPGLPTVNLSFDFISAAEKGDWLETKIDLLKIKRSFGFVGGRIVKDDTDVCRFNGTFYITDRKRFALREEVLARLQE
jgi:uncharacterized protein (TIGR00369 family)